MATPLSSVSLPEKELSAVFARLEDPAIVLAPDHRILVANSRYAEVYGGAEGRLCHEALHRYPRPCDEMGERCPVRECRHGEPSRAVHVHFTPAGARHEEVRGYPVTDAGGRVVSFLEVIRPFRFNAARAGEQGMVGRSPAFNHMLELARRVARRLTPVLLQGETGTGKELLALAVHQLSDRATEPFVPVDCSGISETLFESELFGHERGSFTGASYRKVGLVESAGAGTLFLDEVGDIPPPQQVKLLRLLETGTYRRVGRPELLKSSFRLICATHRNLERMIAEGSFRSDLYYRLSVFPIEVPPLRRRLGDLPLIAESVLRQVGCRRDKKLDHRTLEILERYDFKGNIRELRNILERACMLADGDLILPEHLPAECRGERAAAGLSESEPFNDDIRPLAEVESRYLAWASARFEGDNRELAQRLGISERTLYRKLERLRQGAKKTS